MKRTLIAATFAIFSLPAYATNSKVQPQINIEACEQLTKDAILSAIPPQVTITIEQYKKSAGTLGMVCWIGLQDGYEGKARNPQKLGAMGKEGVDLYRQAYDEGVAQNAKSKSTRTEAVPRNAMSNFYRDNGFDTNNSAEIDYATSLWGTVMKVAKTVQVKPTGETCYLIVTHARNGKITGTRSDGGKSPSGNGPDGDAYCKAVETAVINISMPPVPAGVKKDFDVLSLTYIFEDTNN
jgi:hypothetical protein